jgi:hypothetical protein
LDAYFDMGACDVTGPAAVADLDAAEKTAVLAAYDAMT